MEINLTQRRKGVEEKIPDLKKTLAMVQFLQERQMHPHRYVQLLSIVSLTGKKEGERQRRAGRSRRCGKPTTQVVNYDI